VDDFDLRFPPDADGMRLSPSKAPDPAIAEPFLGAVRPFEQNRTTSADGHEPDETGCGKSCMRFGVSENGNIFANRTRQEGKPADRAVPTDHKSLRACVFLLT
jgi:hypothetical protein